jgi:hypothetical protein
MTAVNLLSPLLNGGIQNINFVNGRILTAEDMTAERTATLQRQRLMGQCIGTGVAEGLEVTLASSSASYGQQVVHVTAGVALNLNGDTLQLSASTDVMLTAALPTTPNNGGLFAPCQPPQTELTNPGVYILTILPATGYQQQVAVAQLNSGGVATSCSSRFTTAGVQFRLAPVNLASSGTGLQPTLYSLANQIQTQLNNNASAASVAPMLSQFRNGLAHACFGTQTLAGFPTNPLPGLSPTAATFSTYGLLDALEAAGMLTSCEVPLAALYWTLSGIQFVDMWSVRRALIAPSIADTWSPELAPRRAIDALSVFLQFQAQMADLLGSVPQATLATARAIDYFLFLPPAGMIAQSGFGPNGFNPVQFFSGRQTRGPFFIEGIRLEPLLKKSLHYGAIDLNADQQMMWLYVIHENTQSISSNVLAPPVAAMIFTTGYIPYQAEPQFDLSHWNYANFALGHVLAL